MANQYANWHKKYSCANFSILILVKQDKSLERGSKTFRTKGPEIYIYTHTSMDPSMDVRKLFALKTKFAPYSYLFFYGQPFVVFAPRFLFLVALFLSYYTTNYFQILLSIKFMAILQFGIWFWFLLQAKEPFKDTKVYIEIYSSSSFKRTLSSFTNYAYNNC